MILVAGSTGVLGSEIVRQLRQQNKPVRALVRKLSDPMKVTKLKALGASIVEGDLTDLASLESACCGIETVITTVTVTASQNPADTIARVDQEGQVNLVNAASRAGASHYVYTSLSANNDTNYPSPLTTAKRTVEQRVMESGMSYTILRPSYFMEIWLSPILGFDYPNKKVTLYGDGKNPISWISVVDVARFAMLAVDSLAARNTILELGGPDKLSPNTVVKIFEQCAGQPFTVEHVPVEVLEAQRASAEDALLQSFSAVALSYAKGDTIDMEQMLQLFPVTLTSVQEYAERVVAVTA